MGALTNRRSRMTLGCLRTPVRRLKAPASITPSCQPDRGGGLNFKERFTIWCVVNSSPILRGNAPVTALIVIDDPLYTVTLDEVRAAQIEAMTFTPANAKHSEDCYQLVRCYRGEPYLREPAMRALKKLRQYA